MNEPTKKVKRIKRGWMNLRVDRIETETHDTKTLFFVDADEGGRPFDYDPGQYLTFRFDNLGEKPLVRSYTMSSSPEQHDFSAVTVKAVTQGIVSNYLVSTVRVGDILRARGPIGKFCYFPETDQRHIFMIAAGSGVTPFVSVLRHYGPMIGKAGGPEKMTLLVSYRSQQDLICWRDLEAAKADGARIICTLSRENCAERGFWHGRIDDAVMEQACGGEYDATTYMTCGPDEMMANVAAFLRAKGVPEPMIKMESFAS